MGGVKIHCTKIRLPNFGRKNIPLVCRWWMNAVDYRRSARGEDSWQIPFVASENRRISVAAKETMDRILQNGNIYSQFCHNKFCTHRLPARNVDPPFLLLLPDLSILMKKKTTALGGTT